MAATAFTAVSFISSSIKDLMVLKVSVKEAVHFRDGYGEGQRWDLYVSITGKDGNCIAQNSYRDIFALSSRVKGHPERMSHETGMRIYWA